MRLGQISVGAQVTVGPLLTSMCAIAGIATSDKEFAAPVDAYAERAIGEIASTASASKVEITIDEFFITELGARIHSSAIYAF
jgi:hypothetical protein